MSLNSQITSLFPDLVGTGASETSSRSRLYNCIAWAAGENDRWWEPNLPSDLGYFWPAQSGGYAVESLIEAYAAIGYIVCADGILESGYEKIAIYRSATNDWTHAARQLPSGKWTSKLGVLEDIEHDHPDHLVGNEYGAVHCYMRRAKD
ncbi:MAG TPA: hypothetical protein VF744_00810 [Beijerinckiaceae bacterium]